MGLIIAALVAAPLSFAQSFPTRPISIVIPLAPGDTGDIAARAMAEELSKILKTPIIAVNRPGAGGAVATEAVVKAARDGYTILYTQNSSLTYRPVTEPSATLYDPIRDLTPLALASRSPMILAVRRDSPYSTFAALVEETKRQKGQVRVGTPGVGSVADFSIHLINSLTNADLVSVPFNGSSPGIAAVNGGHIEGIVATLGVVGPQIKANALRALLTSDKVRELPELPTLQELGYRQGIFGVWFAFLAPAGLPANVTSVLVPAIRAAVEAESVAAKLLPLGILQEYGSPEDLATRIQSEQRALRQFVAIVPVGAK